MSDVAAGPLTDLLRTEKYSCVTQGYSGVEVYHFPDLAAYLKVGPTGKISDLRRERDVLNWLHGHLPVAQVLGYEFNGDFEALLISAVPGRPGSDHMSEAGVTEEIAVGFARKSAAALRRLHDIPIVECPFDMRLNVRFARSMKSIELGLLSETDAEFEAEHGGLGPREVYADLVERRPNAEDLVFTHGDPCMPNIMADGGEISGFIDMDGAGVADRYVDIAIFFRSFRRNCPVPVDLESIFCESYGLDIVDEGKLDYYGLLDDLF